MPDPSGPGDQTNPDPNSEDDPNAKDPKSRSHLNTALSILFAFVAMSGYAYASGLVDVVRNSSANSIRDFPQDNEEEENS